MDVGEHSKDALFAAADQASRGLQWERAVQLWAEYRARFPADMAGYVRAAQALGSAGRLAEAEDLVTQCVTTLGKNVWPAHCYADLAMIAGNWIEAARRWKAAQTDFPHDPAAYLEGVRALTRAGWLDEAGGLLDAAARRFPASAAVSEQYAEFSMGRAAWAEASARWAVMRQRFPEAAAGYTRGAVALHELGEDAQAEELLTQAEQRLAKAGSPDKAQIANLRRLLAEHAMAVEDWAGAAERWAALRDEFPDEVAAYVRGSTALTRLGQGHEAAEVMVDAFIRFPDSLWVAHAYAEAADLAGDLPEMMQRWEQVRRNFPGDPRGFIRGAEALIRSGQLPQALALMEQAATRFPNDDDVTLANLELSFTPSRWSESYGRWSRIVQNAANRPPRFYRLTWLLYLNRTEAAPVERFLPFLLEEKELPLPNWLPQIVVGLTELLFLDANRFKVVKTEIVTWLDRQDWHVLGMMSQLVGVTLGSRHGEDAIVDGIVAHYLPTPNRSLLGFMLSPELARLCTGRAFGFLDAVSRATKTKLESLEQDSFGPRDAEALYNLLMLSYFGERPEYRRLRDSVGPLFRGKPLPAQGVGRQIHAALLAICSPRPDVAPLGRPGRRRLRIALCVSGQLRGYKRANPSWRHLRLDEHDVTIFVHTWQDIGRKMPVGVHANRSFTGNFLTAFRTVAGNVDRRTLLAQYPTFFDYFRSGQAISIAEVRDFYRTDHVVVEDDGTAEFAGFNNPMKMYYKIAQSHRMATDHGEFDLYIRIRPDKFVADSSPDFDWCEVSDRSSSDDIAFCDRAPTIVPEGAFIIGDQFAAGSRHAMDVYSSVWSFCNLPNTKDLYGFPQGFSGHTNLAYTTLYQGVSVELLPGLKFEGPVDEGALPAADIRKLLSLDIGSRTPSETDRVLLDAAEADMAAAT
jgi:tetratricopeptide (TPR) repeat protein